MVSNRHLMNVLLFPKICVQFSVAFFAQFNKNSLRRAKKQKQLLLQNQTIRTIFVAHYFDEHSTNSHYAFILIHFDTFYCWTQFFRCDFFLTLAPTAKILRTTFLRRSFSQGKYRSNGVWPNIVSGSEAMAKNEQQSVAKNQIVKEFYPDITISTCGISSKIIANSTNAFLCCSCCSGKKTHT